VSALPESGKILWRQWDRLKISSGMLYRKCFDQGDSFYYQLVVPKSRQKDVLHYYHDVPSAGHLGAEKMLQRIRREFYWPNLKQEVKNYCQSCDKCFARKTSNISNRAPLGQYLVGEPMERVQIDILGPLPLTTNGNKYILTMCDCFTKWVEAIPLPNQEASTVAKGFVNEFISRFGVPLIVHSDQGTNFESNLFQSICKHLHIEKTRTTSLRPQANGNVERFHRTLTAMLTMYCETKQNQWDAFLPQVMMAYRASPQTSTHMSPNMMVFGREIRLPLSAVIPRPDDVDHTSSREPEGYLQELKTVLQQAHEVARTNLKKSAVYQKKQYDVKATRRSLQKGQAVWLHDPTRRKGVCHKLTSKWKGPYVISRKIDDTTYLVRKSKNQLPKAYHMDRLQPYRGPEDAKLNREQIAQLYLLGPPSITVTIIP
jgi:hypothetical protein